MTKKTIESNQKEIKNWRRNRFQREKSKKHNLKKREIEKKSKRKLKRLRDCPIDKKLGNNEENYSLENEFLYENVLEHSCGFMTYECTFCSSLNFLEERSIDNTFKYCCFRNTVPQSMSAYPEYLRELLCNVKHSEYKNFHENIRSYNCAIAFASMGAKLDVFQTYGPPIIKIHGQIYHVTTHMHPDNETERQYAQLYVIDSKIANQERLRHPCNVDLNAETVDKLDKLMRQINVYAHAYCMMSEIEKKVIEESKGFVNEIPRVNMVFRRSRQESEELQCNTPSVEEVAIVFKSDDNEPPFQRDFKVYPRCINQPFINLNITSPNLIPMVYPLFFPYGQAGWQPNIEICDAINSKRKRKKVTMLKWIVSELAIRSNKFNRILYGGKLTQQFIVDLYLMVEAGNLDFIRYSQKRLRSEQYNELTKYVQNKERYAESKIGRPVILPSSFQGSPRNMREQYHDAIAMMRMFGKPDVFLTITCNPAWKDIKQNLFANQQAFDRPDLVARVFNIKLRALLDDVTKCEIFGTINAFIYTIEFQKRGLPHAHMLFFLKNESKWSTAEQIDEHISAEIPDSLKEPQLHDIVMKTMIHKPCDKNNAKCSCIKDGKCSKNYPKEFSQATRIEPHGYPTYRRRYENDLVTNDCKMQEIDNRWVIPYNKYLLKKYNCHINVESCQSYGAVKYLFKYIYKGYDQADIAIETNDIDIQEHDEIKEYISTRYVCAPEAMWRLLQNNMHDKSHTVYRLPVHLADEQIIFYEQGKEELAATSANNKNTRLTGWFVLNQTDIEARNHLYTEIAQFYTWDKIQCKWNKRKSRGDKIITRIYSVPPKDIERFYLRLLLHHVRGAQSYEDIRKVDNNVCSTYGETALRLNLIADDNEWDKCIEEASQMSMPFQLRLLYALICIFNHPQDSLLLFQKYEEYFIEDYIKNNCNKATAIQRALCDIESTLKLHGLTCKMLKLPIEETAEHSVEEIQNMVQNSKNNAATSEYLISTLNSEQKSIFNEIIKSLETEHIKLFFIDGPGGSGKTYLYNTLVSYFKSQNRSVLCYATTGIAADLLINGRTVHSGFGIPLLLDETSTSNIKANSIAGNTLRKTDVFIIDEVSMLSKYSLQIIDALLRELNGDNCPFGGKLIILGGDFRQTANVSQHASRNDIIEHSIKNCIIWKCFKKRSLTVNMRSKKQDRFNDWILQMGNGKLKTTEKNLKYTQSIGTELIEIPKEFMVKDSSELIEAIFSKEIAFCTDQDVEEIAQKIILSTTNNAVRTLNLEILNLLPANKERTYKSIDSIISDEINDSITYPVEFLNQQNPSGIPEHELKLKENSVIVLLRNLSPSKGMLNGTRLIIKALNDNYIEAKVLTGSRKNSIAFIPRIDVTSEHTDLPFILKRRQFPVTLAFAITIHKSQGQSFKHVGIYLPDSVFTHGQLYVACSRCKDRKNLRIAIKKNLQQGFTTKNGNILATNIVFQELLN